MSEHLDHYDSTFKAAINKNNILTKVWLWKINEAFIDFNKEKGDLQLPLIIERKNFLKEAYSTMLYEWFTVKTDKDINTLKNIGIITEEEYKKVLDYLYNSNWSFVIWWSYNPKDNIRPTYAQLRARGVTLEIYEWGIFDWNLESNDDLLSLWAMKIEVNVKIEKIYKWDAKINLWYHIKDLGQPGHQSPMNEWKTSISVIYKWKSYIVNTNPTQYRKLKPWDEITVYWQVNEDWKINNIIGIK